MNKFTITILLLLSPLITKTGAVPNPPALELAIDQRIELVLLDSGYSTRMIQIIIAQARHESGNFTNSLTVNHNNIFGMRHPKIRPTTSLGGYGRAEGRKGYASYKSVEDATRDYILWCQYVKAPTDTTLKYYVTFLKSKRYYESSTKEYYRAINKWI